MTKISANSSFARAGLREGDLVTTEFLEQMRGADSRLTQRLEQILNRITR